MHEVIIKTWRVFAMRDLTRATPSSATFSISDRPLCLPQAGSAGGRVGVRAAHPDQADRGAVRRPAPVQEGLALHGREEKAAIEAATAAVARLIRGRLHRLPHQNLIQIYSRLFPRQTKAPSRSPSILYTALPATMSRLKVILAASTFTLRWFFLQSCPNTCSLLVWPLRGL